MRRSGTFDHALEEAVGQALNSQDSSLSTENQPEITIDGPRIRIDWSTAGYAEGTASADYSVSVLTTHGTYEEVWCDNEGGAEGSEGEAMTCELDTALLMSEPFGLYYGDSV